MLITFRVFYENKKRNKLMILTFFSFPRVNREIHSFIVSCVNSKEKEEEMACTTMFFVIFFLIFFFLAECCVVRWTDMRSVKTIVCPSLLCGETRLVRKFLERNIYATDRFIIEGPVCAESRWLLQRVIDSGTSIFMRAPCKKLAMCE